MSIDYVAELANECPPDFHGDFLKIQREVQADLRAKNQDTASLQAAEEIAKQVESQLGFEVFGCTLKSLRSQSEHEPVGPCISSPQPTHAPALRL
jgi:hypothetical protein